RCHIDRTVKADLSRSGLSPFCWCFSCAGLPTRRCVQVELRSEVLRNSGRSLTRKNVMFSLEHSQRWYAVLQDETRLQSPISDLAIFGSIGRIEDSAQPLTGSFTSFPSVPCSRASLLYWSSNSLK